MEYFKIVGYEDMQSHKYKNPPWIKIPCDLLDDDTFQKLSDAHKYHFIGLMNLVSKIGNNLPNDENWIAQMIGASEPINLQMFVVSGLIELI